VRNYVCNNLVRKDEQKFEITASLYELPESHNYWLAGYRASHAKWGTMTFTLTIPKTLAATADLAEAIVRGSGESQVRSLLEKADAKGRPLDMVWSNDGWILT
jgi:hypothetical protein